MKISYITTYDANDMHQWSGLGFSIAKMLELENELEYVGNLQVETNRFIKLKQLKARLFKEKFELIREPFVAKKIATQIINKMNPNTELIFSPSSLPLSFLDVKQPKVFYTDATFAGMLDFYGNFSNLSKNTIANGNLVEQRALDTSKLAIYASDWAAQTAISHYGVAPSKVKVVPFGANIQEPKSFSEIKERIQNKGSQELHLLFVGVEWERKGGDLALEIVQILNNMGLKTTLHVVGIPTLPFEKIPDCIVNYGFISKKNQDGILKLESLYDLCHFMLVPSKAEAYGLVYCEANANGIPSIASNVGGITTIIKEELNGKTFSLDTKAVDWATYIYNLFLDVEKYKALCTSSFDQFQKRLNWNAASSTIQKLLNDL